MNTNELNNVILDERWISIEEAAEYLGIKVVTLRGYIKKDNTIPAHRIGRLWKFKKTELDVWVKSGNASRQIV